MVLEIEIRMLGRNGKSIDMRMPERQLAVARVFEGPDFQADTFGQHVLSVDSWRNIAVDFAVALEDRDVEIERLKAQIAELQA